MTELTSFAELVVRQLWIALWQGSLAVLFALFVMRLARSLPAALRCWVWRLVCVKILIAFLWAGKVELPFLPDKTTSQVRLETTVAPAESDGSLVPATERSSNSKEIPSARPSRSSVYASRVSELLALGLAIVWCVGVLWQASLVFKDWRKSYRILCGSTETQTVTLTRTLAVAAKQIGVTTPRLFLSEKLATPVAIGVLEPTIVLPSKIAESFSEIQVRLLLMHELAHIRRRDLTWNWLAVLTRALFFFNPFVWVMQRRWHEAQESACDDVVIGKTPDALVEYVHMLLRCSIPSWASNLKFSTGVTASAGNLKKRIEEMRNRKSFSKSAFSLSICCMAFATTVGVVPWKLVPTTAEEQSTSPTDRRAAKPTVTVAKTFEIGPHESSLAHDGAGPNSNRLLRRQQIRADRQLRMSGRLGGGARGGSRTNVARGTQVQGPNSAGAGGFASGTLERPNYGVALRLSAIEQPAVITVVEGTVAVDDQGNEYKPLTQLGMSRMAVPEFEAANPDCAGMYFRLSAGRRPQSFKEIRGQLRVTPVTIHEATFPVAKLKEGVSKATDFGRIRIGRFTIDDGWKFEVTTPGPGMNIREVFRFAGMVDVELIDSNGKARRPRMKSGAGGGGGVNGKVPGIPEITQIFIFEKLEDGVQAQRLLVRIRELGEEELIAFRVEDVELK